MTSLAQKYTKENPYLTELLENYTLNKSGSQKDTRHFSISLRGSGVEYAPGDALYVYPENDPQMVSELLALLTHSKNDEVVRFTRDINITRASNKLYKLIETKTNAAVDANQLTERFNGYSVPALLKILKQENPSLVLSTD